MLGRETAWTWTFSIAGLTRRRNIRMEIVGARAHRPPGSFRAVLARMPLDSLAPRRAVCAPAHHRQMRKVDLEPDSVPERAERGFGGLRTDLPATPAASAMEMTMLGVRSDVKLLAAFGAMGMADHPQLLEDTQGAVDGRRRGGRVAGPATLHELGARDVPIRRFQDLEDEASLWRPAQAEPADVIANLAPGRRRG